MKKKVSIRKVDVLLYKYIYIEGKPFVQVYDFYYEIKLRR